jgi:hypothetical protein
MNPNVNLTSFTRVPRQLARTGATSPLPLPLRSFTLGGWRRCGVGSDRRIVVGQGGHRQRRWHGTGELGRHGKRFGRCRWERSHRALPHSVMPCDEHERDYEGSAEDQDEARCHRAKA